MQDPDKEIQLESFRKEARARRVEHSRDRKTKMEAENLILQEEESEEGEEIRGRIEKDQEQKGPERVSRKRREDGRIKTELKTREDSRQRTESTNRTTSKQRSESKQRASSSQRPTPAARILQQVTLPQEGDGTVRPKKSSFFDCTKRQPSQSNLEMEINQNDTPSLTDTEDELTDCHQEEQLLEIDDKLRALTIDPSKRKNDSPGQSPPRKIRTPETVDHSGRTHIHRLPELPLSGVSKQARRSKGLMADTDDGHERTSAQVRPHGLTYPSADEHMWQEESNAGLDLIDDIEKDNEMLHDKLDEAVNRLAAYEIQMEERINEMNKMLLDREEELTRKNAMIAPLNKEIITMKEDARIASTMIASKQIRITELQKEVEGLNAQINKQEKAREEEIRGLQNSLAILQSGIHTTDEIIVRETKELHKKIAIMTQKAERLQMENEELGQLLKEAQEESRKHEMTSRTYIARLGQARAMNVQRSESRMSVTNERRILVNNRDGADPREERNLIDVGNSPEIPNDQDNPEMAEAVAPPIVAAPNAHQLLKAVDWPKRKTCFQHDDFCQKVSQTFQRHLAKGIPSHMLSESLHTSLNRQESISRMYNAEIGNPQEITFAAIMQALRNCDREFMELSNYQKWNSLIKHAEESIHSFCKRVYKGYEDYNVGEEGNEDMKIRLIKERIIKGADLPKEVSNSILVCENLTKLPSYILQAMNITQKTSTGTDTQSAQRQAKSQSQPSNLQNSQQAPPRQNYQPRARPQQPTQSQQNYRYRQQFQSPQRYQRPPGQAQQPPIPPQPIPPLIQQLSQPPPNYQSQQSRSQQTAPLSQGQQSISPQTQNTEVKTVASMQMEFSDRAPPEFERNNRGVSLCTNCRKIECGHRSNTCTLRPYCSYCNAEGHTDGDHRSRQIMEYRQRFQQRQASRLQSPQPNTATNMNGNQA